MQEVVILHYFQDLKLKEVADIIGIGLPLVKYRIGKAKELLSVYLGDKKMMMTVDEKLHAYAKIRRIEI